MMEQSQEALSAFDSMASCGSTVTKSTKAVHQAGDPLAEVEDENWTKQLDGVAAKLHMQDLMNHHAQAALAQQSKMMKQGISRFREILREITGTITFDLMIGVLVLVDTALVVLQQELYGQVNTRLDTTQIYLRGASVAITMAFAVEFTARCIAQVGLGWSWLLAMDGFIVLVSFVEVVVYSVDPNNAGALRLLRPLRGLRLMRAARGSVRVLRRSAGAELALSAFGRSLKPLGMILVVVLCSISACSVVLVLQLPGLIDELNDPEVQKEVLERFGSVTASTNTVLEVTFGSRDLGSLLYIFFEKTDGGRIQMALFTGSVLFFLVVTSLCISGIVCGVLLSQVIVQKGDAELDGGLESFRKNQEIVLNLNKVFQAAGFSSSDNINWSDVVSVLSVDKEGQPPGLESLLTAAKEETVLDREPKEDDMKPFKCILEHQGVTVEELREAYHEMSLFGAVSVEDFIMCTFKHVANVKTVSMLSFNHQQNKVFWRIQFHGQLVDEALNEMRYRVGQLHQALPMMIQEVEAASVELHELDVLEARLEQKKQALKELIEQREEECGFAEIPKEETIQMERDEHQLNEMLKEIESEVAKLSDSDQVPLQPKDATDALNALADEMVQYLWSVILEEMGESTLVRPRLAL